VKVGQSKARRNCWWWRGFEGSKICGERTTVKYMGKKALGGALSCDQQQSNTATTSIKAYAQAHAQAHERNIRVSVALKAPCFCYTLSLNLKHIINSTLSFTFSLSLLALIQSHPSHSLTLLPHRMYLEIYYAHTSIFIRMLALSSLFIFFFSLCS
jgi:hypothetical protein